MTHIEHFINNNKINPQNNNLVSLHDLRVLKKIINEDDFILLIKNTNFELKYHHLMLIKNDFIDEKKRKDYDKSLKNAADIANIIYENI